MSNAHSTRIRVRYSEADKMGFVYHVNHLNYFELARSEWVRKFWKPYNEIENAGYALVVIEAHVYYHKPSVYDDILEVEARLDDWGHSRLSFIYQIRRNDDKNVICSGKTSHCFINERGTPCRMPPELHQLLSDRFVKK